MEVWIKYGTTNYSVSNTGKVMNYKTGRILKQSIKKGYGCVMLSVKGIVKAYNVRTLVAMSFLGYDPKSKLVIKYKDMSNRVDHADNLELVTKRDSTDRKHIKHTSKYTGVHWYTRDKCWHSTMTIGKKSKHIGYFEKEEDARDAYIAAVEKLNKQQ